jgi:hypothetical protein
MKLGQDVEFIINHFEGLIKFNQSNIEEAEAKLQKNFCHHFPWVGEDLYMWNFRNDHYKAICQDLKEQNSVDMVISEWKARLERYVSSAYNVRENSSGSLHREASTWKFIASMKLLEDLRKITK